MSRTRRLNNPLPVLSGNEEYYCLTEGNPGGGTYYGNYVSNNCFNIAAAGPGFHEIFYYYSDSYGCSGTAYAIIEVETASDGSIFIQNQTFTSKAYFSGNTITAGSQVSNQSPFGPVIIQAGANAYLKAGNSIILMPGTHIRSGSRFKGVILPIACSQMSKDQYIVDEIQNRTDTKVFLAPNPTHGPLMLFIKNGNFENFRVEVYDNRGMLAYQSSNIVSNPATIDLSGYAPGLYFVRLLDSHSVFSLKVLKY